MAEPPVTIYKYHGTGNDFVIVDTPHPHFDPERLAPQLCDRHRGVGADGVIVIDRAASGFDARMTIFNRDGSRPQMCGNGIRCVARHLVEACGCPTELRIATDAGERRCNVYQTAAAFEVDVDMGVPQQSAAMTWSGAGTELLLHPVNMGNPHAVVFSHPPIDVVDAVGRALNGPDSPFPDGVNVEFTTVTDDNRLDVVVYERGVGRTQACGTGACAAAVAAWATGRTPPTPLSVWLAGGPLQIRNAESGVWMRGDAEFVMMAELGAGWLRSRTQ